MNIKMRTYLIFAVVLEESLGCGDNQTLQSAPWSVSIQFPRANDPAVYRHFCGGALIDNGTKILTAAQCLWKNLTQQLNSWTFSVFDLREPEKNFEGNINTPVFAALAPRCRHLNGVYARNQLSKYWIHPKYNGDPRDGNNIAIVDLLDQFPQNESFPSFEEFLKSADNLNLAIRNIEDITFYGWGAKLAVGNAFKVDEIGFNNNYITAKEVSMELKNSTICKIEPYFQGNSERCAMQSYKNFTEICRYDEGGPLVGRLKQTNKLVLLGLKSLPTYLQCSTDPGSSEIFTDVIKMKDFLLSVLDPTSSSQPVPEIESQNPFTLNGSSIPDGSRDGNPSVIVIIVVVLGGSLLLILFISLIAWKKHSRNQQTSFTQNIQMGSYISLDECFELNEEIKNIYLMLGDIDALTGMVRRHSDLPAALDFLMSRDKIQVEESGHTMFSVDDSCSAATRGVVPSSPFRLAAVQKQQGKSVLQKTQQQIQRILITGQNERIQNSIQVSKALNYGLHNENVNQGLIFPNTPIRTDFDTTIDFEKDLYIGDFLGSGAFGSVYKAVWLTRNVEVAVKIVHQHILEQLVHDQKQGNKIFDSIVGELSLLGRIDNPHVVKCYGGSLKPPQIGFILEYLSQGSLDRFIHSYHGQIPTGLIMRVTQGIAEGLDALHPTIVHRDLKPQNILLDNNYQVKLADFGMSKMKESTYLSDTVVKGTPTYIAPEILEGKHVDEKCDIYALGLIMSEMIAKERPWSNLDFPAIIARVTVKDERPPIPHTCPNELKRLIQRCWTTNPRERPTAREVVQRLMILRRGPTKNAAQDFDQFFIHLTAESTLESEVPSFGSSNAIFD